MRKLPETIQTVAIYARVSTKGKGQDTTNQLRELRSYCARAGWVIAEEYIDELSGSGFKARPRFDQLFEDASRRKFDLVFFWALDRFSREGAWKTLQHLEKLTQCGVSWKSYTEQYLDSAGLFKDALVSIISTLAKQERVRLSERTRAGLTTARAKGTILGRPQKVFDRHELISKSRSGATLRELAREFNLSHTHVARVIKAATQS